MPVNHLIQTPSTWIAEAIARRHLPQRIRGEEQIPRGYVLELAQHFPPADIGFLFRLKDYAKNTALPAIPGPLKTLGIKGFLNNLIVNDQNIFTPIYTGQAEFIWKLGKLKTKAKTFWHPGFPSYWYLA